MTEWYRTADDFDYREDAFDYSMVCVDDWLIDNGMGLRLPIRHGGEYYEIITHCRDHCTYLNEDTIAKSTKQNLFFCDTMAVCHVKYSIIKKTFDVDDFRHVLKWLGTRIFMTEAEAKEYAEQMVAERMKVLSRFGYTEGFKNRIAASNKE